MTSPRLPASTFGARIVALRGARSATATTAEVEESVQGFDAVGGPLVAVCGLSGGAGASTLTALLATFAARAGTAPVLACDAGGATAGLALYLGAESPRSLGEVSELLAAGEPLSGGLFTTTPDGLRVIGTRPRFGAEGEPQELEHVLRDAQAAHGLTVVDCGTLTRRGERAALDRATHVIWMLPATASALARAERVLDDLASRVTVPEAIVARDAPGEDRVSVTRLAPLAEARSAPLDLMPAVPGLVDHDPATALDAAATTMQALVALLHRHA